MTQRNIPPRKTRQSEGPQAPTKNRLVISRGHISAEGGIAVIGILVLIALFGTTVSGLFG